MFHQGPVPGKNEAVVDAGDRPADRRRLDVHDVVVGDTAPVESVCLVAGRSPVSGA